MHGQLARRQKLSTDLTNNLTSKEAHARLGRNGLNELKEKAWPGFLNLLLDQFKNFLIIILIVVVPEGPSAVVPVCLALGMQRMVQQHGLIRKLPVVGTLGS